MFDTFFLRIVLGSLGLTIKFFLGSREEIIWKIFWRLPYSCSTVADVNSNKWQRMLDLMYKSFWCFSVGGWWRRRGEPSLLLPFGPYVCLWVLVNSLLISNCNYGPLFRSSFRQTLGVSISRLTARRTQWSRMQQITGSRASMFRIKCIQIMRIYRANSMNCKWCGSCLALECVSAKVFGVPLLLRGCLSQH